MMINVSAKNENPQTLGSDVPTSIVACCLMHGERVAVLRRSGLVDSDKGKWHCVTGYVRSGVNPLDQAMAELQEETGLESSQIELVSSPDPFVKHDAGLTWIIHPFQFHTSSAQLQLNWENIDYRWISSHELGNFDYVDWLDDVLQILKLPHHPREKQIQLSDFYTAGSKMVG